MGDYLASAGLVPVGGKPASVRVLTVALVTPAIALSVGRIKITMSVPGVKIGDILIAQALAALPGNMTLGDAIVSAANTVDFYLQNTVLLAFGNGATVSVKLLIFR